MDIRRKLPFWPLISKVVGRLSWGIADQGMSSLTNFAVNIFTARELGAISYGAFGLAYVTYSFCLNASRGLATDPLLVRFSGVEKPAWRRATGACTGTAAVVGLIAGIGVLVAAIAMRGSVKEAFIALGLTLPGLMLQDSWRYCFFAAGRGVQALLNDIIWGTLLIPSLIILKITHQTNVFWFLLAWGLSATAAALAGLIQSRIRPSPSLGLRWVQDHRDLGPRYLLEGTTNSASTQLRNYAVSVMLGLAAVGYVQGASTLMGPFMVIFFGMGLVVLPEAARALRRSVRHFTVFCALVSAGLALSGAAWMGVLLIALPRGLGHEMLGSIWQPTYPLIVPLGISVIGGCVQAGAGAGLHALGVSKRSLRAMFNTSVFYVACTVVGAHFGGAVGTMDGAAVSGLLGAVLYWWELFKAIGEHRMGTTKAMRLDSGKADKQFTPGPHTIAASKRDSA